MATNWVKALMDYVDSLEAAIGAIEGATALHNKLTAARAALLDQITALRMAELDAVNIPADVDTLLSRLTALRAGYLDNLSGGAVALAVSWTAALATALGNYTAARAGYLENINQAGLLQVTAARAALLDQITALRLAELDAANIPADIDTLLARLTALRAGYLDNLSAGAVSQAAALTTHDTDIKARLLRQVPFIDYWSAPTASITITNAAADLAFPDVVVAGIPAGAVILRVVALLKPRVIQDTSGAQNRINAAGKTLRIKASAGVWPGTVAINFAQNQWTVEAAVKEGGDLLVGDQNLSAVVVGNDTYNFASRQTVSADALVALGNNLVLQDVYCALRVYFQLA